MNSEKTGKFILKLRKDNNLTQAEFADEFGVTYQAVSKWETGKNIPDLLILKEICNKFNVDINEILDGEKTKKRRQKSWLYIGGFVVMLTVILTILLFSRTDDSDFQFKVLSSGCEHFTISGSVAYNKSQSHIYISRIDYCGGDDTTEFVRIECILYHSDGNTKKLLDSHVKENKEGMTLEEFLQDITFHLDDFDLTCPTINIEEMFLQIKATDRNNRTITHRIPLVSQLSCPNL